MNLREKYTKTIRSCEDFKLVHDNNKRNYRVWIQEFKKIASLLEKALQSKNSRKQVEEIRQQLKTLQDSMKAARNHLETAFEGHQKMVENYLGPKLDSNYQTEGKLFAPEDYEIPAIPGEDEETFEHFTRSGDITLSSFKPVMTSSPHPPDSTSYQEMVMEYTKLKNEYNRLKKTKIHLNTLVEAFEKLWVNARNLANIDRMNICNRESFIAMNDLMEVEQQIKQCLEKFKRVEGFFKVHFNRKISLSNSRFVNREEEKIENLGELKKAQVANEREDEQLNDFDIEPSNQNIIDERIQPELEQGVKLPENIEEDRKHLNHIKEILNKRNQIKSLKETIEQLDVVKKALANQWTSIAIRRNEKAMTELRDKQLQNEEASTKLKIEYDYCLDEFRQLQLDFHFTYGTFLPLNDTRFDSVSIPNSVTTSVESIRQASSFEPQTSLRDFIYDEIQAIKYDCDKIGRKTKHYEELMMNLVEKSEKAEQENELVVVMKLDKEMIKVSNRLAELKESLKRCRDDLKRKQEEYKQQFRLSARFDEADEGGSTIHTMNNHSVSLTDISEEELIAIALERKENFLEVQNRFVSCIDQKKTLNELLWKANIEENEDEKIRLRQELAKRNDELRQLKNDGLLEHNYEAFLEVQRILSQKYHKVILLEEPTVDENNVNYPRRSGAKSFSHQFEHQEIDLQDLKEDVENWTPILVQQLLHLNELYENLRKFKVFVRNGRSLSISNRMRMEKNVKTIESMKRLIRTIQQEHSKAVKNYLRHRSLYLSLQ